jgi:hypothetical protein
VTLRARWVTLRAWLGDAKSSLGDAESSLGDADGTGMRMDVATTDPAFAHEEEKAAAHATIVPRGINMAAAEGAAAASSNPDGCAPSAVLVVDG